MLCPHLPDVAHLENLGFHPQPNFLNPLDDHCFHLSKGTFSFLECEDVCGRLNGTLATVTSSSSMRLAASLREIVTSSQEGWWIGLYKHPFGGFSWVNGDPYEKDWNNWVCPKVTCGPTSCNPPEGTCGNHFFAMHPPNNENRTKFFVPSSNNATLHCLCESSPGSARNVDNLYIWAKDSFGIATECPSPTFPAYSFYGDAQYALNAFTFLSIAIFFVAYLSLTLISCYYTHPLRDAEINPHSEKAEEETRKKQSMAARRPSNAARILAKLSKHKTVGASEWNSGSASQEGRNDERLTVPILGTRVLFFTQGYERVDRFLRSYVRIIFCWYLFQFAPQYAHVGLVFNSPYSLWVTGATLLPIASFTSHYLISRVLRESPKHLGKLLTPLAEGDPREFERMWRASHDSLRKNTVMVLFVTFLMGIIRTSIFPQKGIKPLVFVNTWCSTYFMIETLVCFVSLLELMTEGHTYLVRKMESDVLDILREAKEEKEAGANGGTTDSIAEVTAKKLDKVNEANRKMMTESQRLVLFGVYIYGVGMLWSSVCFFMMVYHAAIQIPCNKLFIFRAFLSSLLTYVAVRSFVRHIRLVAKVGDAYHRMVRNFGSAESFQLSVACFGDPTALRDMYDTNEIFKSHAWVVFAYPVDSTLVWTIITSVMLAIALALPQAF